MSELTSRVLLYGQELPISDWRIDFAGTTTKFENIDWSKIDCTKCTPGLEYRWCILEVVNLAIKGNLLVDESLRGLSQMMLRFISVDNKEYEAFNDHIKCFNLIEGSKYHMSTPVRSLLDLFGCQSEDVTYDSLKRGEAARNIAGLSRGGRGGLDNTGLDDESLIDDHHQIENDEATSKETIMLGELMKLFGSTDTTDEMTILSLKTIACTAFAFLTILPRLVFKRAKSRLDYISNSQLISTALSCFPLLSEELFKALVRAADDSAFYQVIEHSGTPRVDLVSAGHYLAVINARKPFRALGGLGMKGVIGVKHIALCSTIKAAKILGLPVRDLLYRYNVREATPFLRKLCDRWVSIKPVFPIYLLCHALRDGIEPEFSMTVYPRITCLSIMVDNMKRAGKCDLPDMGLTLTPATLQELSRRVKNMFEKTERCSVTPSAPAMPAFKLKF